MSALIVGVAKLTFGMLSKKACAYGAEKLQNGGLVDKQFRNIIVGELDHMKYQLTAISRKELKNGISCFNQGVERLNLSFTDSVDGPGQLPNAIQNQSLTSTEPSSDLMTGVERALTRAARDAGLAFNNDALSEEDKILACTVRIASGILEHLTYPQLAVIDCIGYLKELNTLPAIFRIFNVHATGGFKAAIKKESRAKIIESVIAINLFLLNFITTFATEGKAFNSFNWPLIECHTDTTVYHPIYYEFMMNEPTSVIPPWCIRALLHYKGLSAVNSKGDIILSRRRNTTERFLAKLDRETGKLEQLNIPAFDKEEDIECNYLAVDEDDTVYFLTCYGKGNRYNLSVCDSNGKVIHHQPVKFLKGRECLCFGITKDKRLVSCLEFGQNDYNVYIHDRNGQLEYSFPVRIPDNQVVKDMFSSSSNEIILVAVKKEDKSSSTIFLYVYSVEGLLKRRPIKLRLPAGSKFPSSCTVRYDYRANNFICLASTTTFRVWKYLRFTEDGELLKSCDLNMYTKQLGFNKPNLSSHPKGNVALICQNGALFV